MKWRTAVGGLGAMTEAKWRTAVGGLVRYRARLDEAGYPESYDIDFFARGVGWTSMGAAQTSWTAAEVRSVKKFVSSLEVER